MALLPASGTISYNGYTWPVETKTVSIDIRPEYDQAGRTVIYNVFSITLEWKVVASGSPGNPTQPTATIEATVADIRKRLTSAGGAFRYQDKGFGDLIVNVSSIKDVVWGPKPKLLTFFNPRNRYACTLRWQCDVAIPDCSNAKYAFAPMAFNFRTELNVDRAGYTQRTITGYIQIPQTRQTQSTRTLTDHVDKYYEKCVPDVPEGFRRTSSRRTISENKCRLDFTFVDEEMVVPFPPGVIDVQASESRQTVKPSSFVQWAGVITADYELSKSARSEAKQLAFDHFVQAIVNPRLAIITAATKKGGGISKPIPGHPAQKQADTGGSGVIPMHLHIEEPEIYGRRTARFTFTYTVACSLPHLLTDGLWQPIPGTSDRLWRASVANVLGPRGGAGLRMDNSEDMIVDLCQSASIPKERILRSKPQPGGGQQSRTLKTTCPPEDSSWIDYVCRQRVEVNGKVVEHKPLPGSVIKVLRSSPGGGTVEGNFDRELSPGDIMTSRDTTKSKFQQIGAPTIEIVLYGYATRACYEVAPPTLKSFGGRAVVMANDPSRGDHFESWVEGNAGVPIMKAKWQLRWKVEQVPTERVLRVAPPNPRAEVGKTRVLRSQTQVQTRVPLFSGKGIRSGFDPKNPFGE